MRAFRRFIGLSLILLLPLSATPAIAAKLPAPVVALMSELHAACRNFGGKLVNPEQAILSADLNGDRRPDYVIDQSALTCQGAASTFSGSGGSQVDVFSSTPSGYLNAWSGGAFGAEIQRKTLWLFLGGHYCSQKQAPSRAQSTGCKRALAWKSSSKKMILDPSIQPRSISSN